MLPTEIKTTQRFFKLMHCSVDLTLFSMCLLVCSIVTMLRHLERMLTSFAVPVAFIHGDR